MSPQVWIVGSQQGFMGSLDDCIIHGIFQDRVSAMVGVARLQKRCPSDTFGLICVPTGVEVHVGFNLNSAWTWFKPQDGYDTDSSCTNLILPDHLTTETGLSVSVQQAPAHSAGVQTL